MNDIVTTWLARPTWIEENAAFLRLLHGAVLDELESEGDIGSRVRVVKGDLQGPTNKRNGAILLAGDPVDVLEGRIAGSNESM